MLTALRTQIVTMLLIVVSSFTTLAFAQNAYTDAGLDAPTVTSDKDDYAPGEVAHIRGTGWTLDQQVHVEFKESPDYPCTHIYDLTVNPDGSWQLDYQIEDRHIGVTFTVIAKGKTTGYTTTTTFTDATWTLTPNQTICASQTATLTFTIKQTNNASPNRAFRISFPSGFSLASPSITSVTGSKSWTISVSGQNICLLANDPSGTNQLATNDEIIFTVSVTAPSTPGVNNLSGGASNSNSACPTSGTAQTGTPTISVNPSPDNVSNGFTGNTICTGGTGTLTFDAVDASFSTPYSISYTDGTTTWTQAITSASATTFNVAVNPTVTTTYTLTSITSGNGCTRTTGFTDATAQINVSELPTTADAGSDQTICPGSSATLAANTPTEGTGLWSVVSGPSTLASQFSSTTSPTATFTPAGGNGTYTLRWTISNTPCSPSTDDVDITMEDETDPVITSCPATRNITGCGTDAIIGPAFSLTSAASSYTVFSDATNQGEASDNCGITSVTYQDEESGTCPIVVTRTWTISDAEGNTATCEQTINIEDETAPTLTGTAYSQVGSVDGCQPTQAEAEGAFSTANAIQGYSDNCSATVTATLTNTVVEGTDCAWSVTYTYTVTDDCGNDLTNQSYTTQGGDETAPTLTGTAYSGTTGINSCKPTQTAADAAFNASSAANGYMDNCGGAVTAELTSAVVSGTNCSWSVLYTFSVKDECGNTLTGQTYTNSGGDKTAPTLTSTAYTGTSGTNACMANAATAAPFNATNAAQGYTDNCGGTVTAELTGTSVTGTDAAWTVTYTYKVKDACGNELTGRTYSNSGSDQTAPTISTVTVDQPCLWPPNHKMRNIVVTVNATDNCSSDPLSTWKILSVTSNEPENGTGDGNTTPDWVIGSNGKDLQLRSERQGTETGRVYTITVEVEDGAGNKTTKTATVIVAHNITFPGNGNTYKVGSTVNLAGTFWDVPGKKHTAKWLIDGVTVNGTVTAEPSGLKNGTVTGSYKFTTPGIYKLQMNMTDQSGVTTYANTNGDLEAVVVVYDPNGGYTVGNGCFTSPAGALRSDPQATGVAHFGFQTNYYKTATNPKGETQFDFRIGDFEYNALNFEYLVVSGAKAQFKGSGKIVGYQSGIDFIMTVIDGQLTGGGGVDKIRMKIYNKNTGQVYYDNESGSDANAPTTAVCAGSVVTVVNTTAAKTVITTQQKTRDVVVAEEPLVTELTLKAFPNPTTSFFNVSLQSSNTKEKIVVRVLDLYGRQVEVRDNLYSGQTLSLGSQYRPGMYIVEMIQGNERRQVKVLKQPD